MTAVKSAKKPPAKADRTIPVVITPHDTEMSALMAILDRCTREAIDVDRIERVYAMIERARAAQSERAFNSAMAEAQGEMEPIVRSADNASKGSKYAPLEAIVEAITPVLKKHGFGTSFQTTSSGTPGYLKVLADVVHEGGHKQRYEYDVPLDNGLDASGEERMSAPQSYGSTTSYARRYAVVMIFNLTTKDAILKDRDGETQAEPELVSADQVGKLLKLMQSKNMKPARFCGHFKIKDVTRLPASKFSVAVKAINAVAGDSAS